MEIFGNIWNSLEIFGIPWKYLEFLGNIWNSLEIFGVIWKYLEVGTGIFWKYLEIKVEVEVGVHYIILRITPRW